MSPNTFAAVTRAARRARKHARNSRPKRPVIDFKPGAPPCPNCGRPGPHFAPPSFGEAGFYTCEGLTPGRRSFDIETRSVESLTKGMSA